MFPLNFTRPRRHVAATIALVVVTILPTIYVGYTAWRIGRPSYLREVEREVGGPLGLKVSLSSVRYPRPGEVVYRGVVIRQEEPRRNRQRQSSLDQAVGPRTYRGDRWTQNSWRKPPTGDRAAWRAASEVVERAGLRTDRLVVANA